MIHQKNSGREQSYVTVPNSLNSMEGVPVRHYMQGVGPVPQSLRDSVRDKLLDPGHVSGPPENEELTEEKRLQAARRRESAQRRHEQLLRAYEEGELDPMIDHQAGVEWSNLHFRRHKEWHEGWD